MPPTNGERIAVHTPAAEFIANTQMSAFVRHCENATGQRFPDAPSFHSFSTREYRRFWSLFLAWSGIEVSGSPEPVCTDDACRTATFFPSLTLSYVANLLRDARAEDGARTALVACNERGERVVLTRAELRDRVLALATELRAMGIGPGACVVGIASNTADAVVACLGSLALGATWSSTSPDMGNEAIVERFAQLAPRVVFAHSSYLQNGQSVRIADRLAMVVASLPPDCVVVSLGADTPSLDVGARRQTTLDAIVATGRASKEPLTLATLPRLPFNHPLFVLFSSGTTGRPKCIIHGAGGTLIEHLKEHRLHGDLSRDDTLFFHTTCAWMMWNWQLSALACGAAIVLYDGSPVFPEIDALWRVVADERVTVFGTSPTFLQHSRDADLRPGARFDLGALRALQSTGSILAGPLFEWAVRDVKPVPVQSISGGTDILGCFLLGHPNLPVYAGELQSKSLGLDVRASGATAENSGVGELVCANPFPSRPLGLVGDPTGERFVAAYFSRGPDVWEHGDWVELTPGGGGRIHGRSDGVMNIRGIRIGPAEIYAALADVPEVSAAMAIEQRAANEPGGSRLVLLVVPAVGAMFDGPLAMRIRRTLVSRCSAAHSPSIVVEVKDLPTTFSGKRSERAASDALNGRVVSNAGALRNPESLDAIRAAVEAADLRVVDAAPVVSGEIETKLAAIFRHVLGLESVGPTDGFLDLGGHSLAAVRMVAAIERVFGTKISLAALFAAQTIEKIAALVRAAPPAADRATNGAHAAHGPSVAHHLVDDPTTAGPTAGTRIAPASAGQASLWFLRQVMPYKSPYNLAVSFDLTGEIDASALAATLREIVRRHESLRTTFTTVDGRVAQVIHDDMQADVAISDLAASNDPEGEARRIARETAAEPFDVAAGPLVRVRVLRIGPRAHRLVVVMDHIISDGVSLGVMLGEIEAIYPAFRAGRPSPLPPVEKQYARCVAAQNAWMESATFAGQLAQWKEHLTGAAPCDLPTDRPRPPIKSYRGGLARARIPRELADRLRKLSAREGVSLFASLVTMLEVLLARYSGQTDITVLVPFACRHQLGAESVVGYFANMLVLRNEVSDRMSSTDLLRSVGTEVLHALDRENVPFERVVTAVRPDRSSSHDPFASVGLSLLPARGSTLRLPGVDARYEQLSNGGATFDLHFFVSEVGGDLICAAEYNGDVFDAETIERLLGHYGVLLEAAVTHPAKTIAQLPLMTREEEHRVLVEWNATEKPLPTPSTIHELVRATAMRVPDARAASFEGQTLTYAELTRRSRQIARCLQARGVGPNVLVGVAVERSLDMLAALLGILEAGGAYVPLDPGYPRDRLAFVAEDSGIKALVTEARLGDLVPAPAGVLRLDSDAAEIAAQSDAPLGVSVDPESLAYVIYTSGSTGKPKGVEIPHRAAANFLATMAERPGLTSSDSLLAVTSLSFDIAGLEMWLPLTVGAHVEIVSRETAGDGAALRTFVDSGRITVLQATPSTFRLLLAAGWSSSPHLKVLIGGEATPRELAEKLLERAGSVWNMYGPTETTIWSCVQPLAKGAPVLIGRPIANTQIYVLDKNLAPVPAGITGELFIGGAGVAHGYLGRPELTSERFLRNPFAEGRIYRTGDLCRQRTDGAIEFLGRADFQVKFRGYRIELGEIEAVLATHPRVREAVVVAHEDGPGEQKLVAYLTPKDGALPDAGELRTHLRAKLPDYMVPAQYIALERLPLTANNKIDRKALPKPERVVGTAAVDEGPREALDVKLRAIWEEVLGVRGIGMNDSFFDIGGHSLLALKLFDRIEKSIGMKLPVTALFEAPTIEKLGALLRRGGWTPSWSSLVPIQTAGTKPPFFCVHAVGGNVLNYRLLSRYLGDDQPFYGVQARGLGGTEDPHTTIEEMATAYIEEIKTVQPHGPYYLGGSSSGGVTAYEMAQQLHARGEKVAAVVLLDTHVFGPVSPVIAKLRDVLLHYPRGLLLDHHIGEVLLRTPRGAIEYLSGRVRARLEGVSAPIEATMKQATPVTRRVYEANVRAIMTYVPRPYPGTATLLLSRDLPHRTAYDKRLVWADLVQGGLTIRFMPGDHETMLDEPVVAEVAPVLAQCLG